MIAVLCSPPPPPPPLPPRYLQTCEISNMPKRRLQHINPPSFYTRLVSSSTLESGGGGIIGFEWDFNLLELLFFFLCAGRC